MILKWLTQYRDFGLLFARLVVGGMFVFVHGWPKIAGGAKTWEQLGGAMSHLGITAFPVVWGLLAAVAEFGGGILFIAGFFFRPACALLAATMFVAAVMKLSTDGTLFAAAHPIEIGAFFVAMLLTGPGRYSVDRS